MGFAVRKLPLILVACACLVDAASKPPSSTWACPCPCAMASASSPTFICPLIFPPPRHPGAHTLRQGADINANYQAFVDHATPSSCRTSAAATKAGAFNPSRGNQRWRRHPELGGAPALVQRQNRHDRRLVRRHRPVEGRARQQSTPEGDLPRGFGYDEYRDRYYPPAARRKLGNRLEWMAENLRARGITRISASSCSTCLRAAPMWRRLAGRRPLPRRHQASLVRRLLARNQHEGAPRQNQGPSVFRRRLVRQFR